MSDKIARRPQAQEWALFFVENKGASNKQLFGVKGSLLSDLFRRPATNYLAKRSSYSSPPE
jgi:hypothetical protein